MRITIIGSGAMGCRFGVAFRDAGAEVWLYDIWAKHIDEIRANGLKVKDGLGGARQVSMNAQTDMSKIPDSDVLVIFTKSMYTREAMEKARALVSAKTSVVTLQNGLGNIEAIRDAAGDVPVIAGVTNYASDLIGPGEVELKGSGLTRMMALDDRGNRVADELCELLTAAGHNARVSENVLVDIWEKVAFNAALNTVTAVTGLSVGGAGNTPEGKALLFAIAGEVVCVANALGVAADGPHVRAVIESVFDPRMSGDHKTSMLQDVLAGRKTELDAVCGQVIARGGSLGMALPRLETMYALVNAVERGYDKRFFK